MDWKFSTNKYGTISANGVPSTSSTTLPSAISAQATSGRSVVPTPEKNEVLCVSRNGAM